MPSTALNAEAANITAPRPLPCEAGTGRGQEGVGILTE